MDAQIIAVAAAVVGSVITVGVTLGLALLNGFRRLHNKIDQTAKENREDNAAQAKQLRKDNAAQMKQLRKDNAAQAKQLRKDIAKNAEAIAKNAEAIAKNAEAIAGIGGSMTIIEKVLNTILVAVMPNQPQTHATANTPVNAATPQSETEQDARTASAAGS